ncbi:MAG: hypothetical protein ACPGYV_01425 [Phycisphaeraceae bacterium]
MQPLINKDQSPELLAARFRQTLDLHRAGVRMKRAQLEHNHPDETEQQIIARLNEWLQAPGPDPYQGRNG